MEHTSQPLVVGVRFSKVGKVYHFSADLVTDIKVGDQVVVETSRGWQLGQVAQIVQNAETPPDGWKPIDRRATPRDLLLRQMWQMKEAEVVTSCRNKSNDLNLVGIKIVSAEYSFDGSRLTILFSSETEEKYDLKSLRQDMQKMYAPSQVEMRQIGPRDVAKTVCGMGACGLETRCCCLFLTEFSSISIRMAKEQGISLTPTEITGMCGRLRCCLIYEYDNYVEARAKLPKRNKRVRTPQGEGKVVDVVPLRSSVIVDLPEVGHREFQASEIITLDANGQPEPGQTPPGPAETYHGTQQPSVMDQVITGDETINPFVITSKTPPPESNWENPPKVEQPRSMPAPRGNRPEGQRPGGPRQGGERRDRRDFGGRKEPGAGGTDQPREGDQPQQGAERQRQEPRQGGGRDRGPRQGRSQGGRGPQGERPPQGERGGQPGGQQGERTQQNERPPRQGDQQQPGGRGPRREGRPPRPQGGPRQPGDQQRGAEQSQRGADQQRNADQSQRGADQPQRNESSQGPADQTPRAGNEAGGGNSPRGRRDNRRNKGQGRRRDNNEPEERA